MLTDYEVAKALHDHRYKRSVTCDLLVHPVDGQCSCDYDERVRNTFLVLRAVRIAERQACENITREHGGARAADMIRDRDKDDDKR